jgi:hypothetical protein
MNEKERGRSGARDLILPDISFDISISLGFLVHLAPGGVGARSPLIQVSYINTLFPIAFQGELTSNIGLDIDRV